MQIAWLDFRVYSKSDCLADSGHLFQTSPEVTLA